MEWFDYALYALKRANFSSYRGFLENRRMIDTRRSSSDYNKSVSAFVLPTRKKVRENRERGENR